MIPEAHHSKPVLLQVASALLVVPALFRFAMMCAIHLDYQLIIDAAEISEIGTNREFAPEFKAKLLPAQSRPQLPRSIGRFAAKPSGSIASESFGCHLRGKVTQDTGIS